MILQTLSVSVFVGLFFAGHCGNARKRFTLPREGFRLNDASVTEIHNATSVTVCLSICTHLSWCKTASFRPTAELCLLSSDDVTNDENADAYLMSTSVTWVTWSKALYTVFQRIHPDGEYKATYNDAVTLCNEMNTVVASESDLLASKALGMDYPCKCGWLSDQTIVYINDVSNMFCAAAGLICQLNGKANVWCRL